MPVIRTLSFANYRTPTQTDFTKIRDIRSQNQHLQAVCRPGQVPGLPPARLASVRAPCSGGRLPCHGKTGCQRAAAGSQSTGLATLAEGIPSHNPSSSSPCQPGTSTPRWGRERSAPRQPLNLKMWKGKFQLGKELDQNTCCPF